jgi:hypothetical protein
MCLRMIDKIRKIGPCSYCWSIRLSRFTQLNVNRGWRMVAPPLFENILSEFFYSFSTKDNSKVMHSVLKQRFKSSR